MFGFDYLFKNGIKKEDFLNNHFDKAVYYFNRKNKNYYEGLLNINDYDSIITSSAFDTNNIRLTKNGEIISINNVLSNNPNFQYVSNEKIIDEYLNGTTIVLEKFHRYRYEVNLLCKQIQYEFDCAVNINSYLTPPNSQGFDFHFDKHSVIILQMYGTKKWFIEHQPYEKLPIHGVAYDNLLNYHSESIEEIELNAGDLLYIPRGHVHKAVCNDLSSLHLSIGLHPLFLKDYIIDRIDEYTKGNEDMRTALTSENSKVKSLSKSLNNLSNNISNNLTTDILTADIKSNILKNSINTIQKNRFINIISLSNINTETIIEFNYGVYFYIEDDIDPDYILLKFNSKSLKLPSMIQKDIQKLSGKKQVKHLFKMFDSNAVIEITKILLTNGLFKIADE